MEELLVKLKCWRETLINTNVWDVSHLVEKHFFLFSYAAQPMKRKGESSAIAAEGRPMGMVDTLKTIFKEEGLRGLYRGLLPNFLKVIPAVSIGYVVYEQLKLVLNVKTVR